MWLEPNSKKIVSPTLQLRTVGSKFNPLVVIVLEFEEFDKAGSESDFEHEEKINNISRRVDVFFMSQIYEALFSFPKY